MHVRMRGPKLGIVTAVGTYDATMYVASRIGGYGAFYRFAEYIARIAYATGLDERKQQETGWKVCIRLHIRFVVDFSAPSQLLPLGVRSERIYGLASRSA